MKFTEQEIATARELAAKALSKPPFMVLDGKLGVALNEFAFRILAVLSIEAYPADCDYIVLAANEFPSALSEIEQLRAALKDLLTVVDDHGTPVIRAHSSILLNARIVLGGNPDLADI